MSVFRVEKNKNYTVMSNHHLRNKELSLKSKGLLSLMLSLPDEWDYTLKGLSMICKEGIDAIRVSIVELENHGYIERRRNRNEKGQLTNTEYIIREFPITVPVKSESPMLEEPTLENPILDNPTQEKPILENSTQINKDKTIKKELNKDCIKYPSINHETSIGSIDRYRQNIKQIKDTMQQNKENFINAIRRFMEMKKLTAPLLRELIDKITVYETEGVGKNRSQRVMIHYKFIGYIEIPECGKNYRADTRKGVAVEYVTKSA